MKKLSIIYIFIILLNINCATLYTLSEEMLPLSKRLFSPNSTIRENAIKEFMALDVKGKEKVLLEIVDILKNEKDADTQKRIITALIELKAGSYIIIPLLEVVKQNADIKSYFDIIKLLNSIEPEAEKIVFKLADFLKDDKWEVRMLVLSVVRKMAKKSEILVPEIIKTLQKFGDEPERFNFIFDTLSMIEPEIAISQLILEIKNKSEGIRKNTVEKLIELQANLSPKLKIKKEINTGLLRVLFSEEGVLTKIVKDTLYKIDDKELKMEYEKYLELSRGAVSGIARMVGSSLQDVFSSQEEKLKKKMKDYFEKIGRQDAIKDMIK
ncbi:MAG: hypothetical protein N2114_00385 [Candidatus Goldbacteria bacterium]|nr:hypothetical protein [Candidatus Goldiibacteriota bacterium]